MAGKERLLLFYVLLFIASVLIVSTVWNANGYFFSAYKPIVEESNERHRLVEEEKKSLPPPSSQPRGHGFSESEIEKQHGNRYDTY
jgi:hypothetical protein